MRPRNQPEILLRRADRSDLGALLSLIHRFATESGESGGGVGDAVVLERALRHLVVYMTYFNDDPTGYVLGMESLGGRGSATPQLPGYYLCDLYVEPSWRQHGLGRAMLSAMLQTPTSWGPTRFLRWETSTRPEAAQANAFYERVFPERHVGQPFVWPAPPDAADITPERSMAFRPRRLMTDQAWLSVEPAFSTQSGRWFARLHELAGERADVPQLLSAVASDGYAHLSMAETLDLPEGEAQNLIPGCYPLDQAQACLVVFPPPQEK